MFGKFRSVAVLLACVAVFSVASPALAGWFSDDKPELSDSPNQDGAWLGTACAVFGGIAGFVVGGPLGAAAGAALCGGAGVHYGNASDKERAEWDKQAEIMQDGVDAIDGLLKR